MSRIEPLESALLPPGIRSRHVDAVNGLTMHILEAGFEGGDRPGMILLHGFPELAYSWRKVMLPLAAAGYHVVAPDQRGYGRTVGWNAGDTSDLSGFRLLNLVRDVVGLLHALGWRSVVISGHDFGSLVAAWCALLRPDLFHAVALLSSPFPGAPPLPSRVAGDSPASANIHEELAQLDRPRKHYQWYYSSRPANTDMLKPPQGLHAFLRAYFHVKSGDWPGNRPFPLSSWSANELAKLPTYYTMELNQSMPETVAPHMPTAEQISACRWLPDDELCVYTNEFARTGFTGGLQWYRCKTSAAFDNELQIFSGRTIDVPAIYVAGKHDWGTHQFPDNFEKMQSRACRRFLGTTLIDGAGHWVQQEQPERVSSLLVDFLKGIRGSHNVGAKSQTHQASAPER